jgi:hypothetical protein
MRSLRTVLLLAALAETLALSAPVARAAVPSVAVGEPHAGTPAWLLGVWTREWVHDAEGQRDDAEVYYLQVPGFFADLRIERNRPSVAPATDIAQLDAAGVDALAGSTGFAGRTMYAQEIMHWQHNFEFQPPDGSEDAGYARRAGADRMRETGLDGTYEEAWRRLDSGGGRFLVLRAPRNGGEGQLLVVVGDHFMYVRNRAAQLPQAESMRALLAAQPGAAASALDCEFSYGRIIAGGRRWLIRRSTLPWREGSELAPSVSGIAQSFMAGCAARAGNDAGWQATLNTFARRRGACASSVNRR